MLRSLRLRVARWRPIVLVTVLALVLFPRTESVMHAAEADLDLTFGPGGKVTTDFAGQFDAAAAMVLQTDGRIVVVGSTFLDLGDFALARYQTDGTLDASFGVGGRVTTDFGGTSDMGLAVALQADGKIVVAGETVRDPFNQDFALARYNSDGSLDPTFGSGGRVTTDFGSEFFEGARAVAIQSDGKILAAGATYDDNDLRNFAIARYNADGSLDTSFDTDGRVITSVTPFFDSVSALVLLPDGRIVAVGSAGSDFGAARYNDDGSLDATFGTAGTTTTDFANGFDVATAALLQEDGRIIAVGGTSGNGDDFALARYNEDGSLDETFGTDGTVTTDIGAGSADFAAAAALHADGRIVAAGRTTTSAGDDFAVARYDATGTLDPTFGGTGKVSTDIQGGSDDGRGVAIQEDGKILVAGQTAFGPAIGFSDFAVVRYGEPPPPHDLTFYLHGLDVPGTAGGFTMNATAPPTQVLVAVTSSLQWFSDPAVNGTFIAGATFQVTLPCTLGLALPKTVQIASTDASGGDPQTLGQTSVGLQLCQSQTIAVPVTVPVSLGQRRVRLTISSAVPLQPLTLGGQTFLRATNFVGTP